MQDFESLRQRLDEHYAWPTVYTFKFIVPRASSKELLSLFESDTGVSVRESRGGKYLSLTATVLMPGSESVIAVYEAVAEIEGIISL
ncbi:MAG: DUF493 family protein [Desulfohalobiaceae bacterium]